MQVLVDVPQDAEVGNYQGKINVSVIPAGTAEEGTVTIVTGGQIRIELTVSEEKFSDFKVRTFGIPTLEESQPVKVSINIENTGNAATAPSKVHLDVYDKYHGELLWTGDDTSLDLIESFTTKTIFAEFPIELGVDYYWGEVEIFKGEEIVTTGKIYFGVVEKGTLTVTTEEDGNRPQNQLSNFPSLYIGAGIIFLLSLGLLIWAERKRRKVTPRRKKTNKKMDIKKKEEEKKEK
jgi:hypothetical protein